MFARCKVAISSKEGHYIASRKWPAAGDVRTERQFVVMPLTLRRALLSPAHADRQDWIVLDDGQEVGRIYEDRSESTPRELRWFWSITRYVPPRLNVRTMISSDRSPRRKDAAKPHTR